MHFGQISRVPAYNLLEATTWLNPCLMAHGQATLHHAEHRFAAVNREVGSVYSCM